MIMMAFNLSEATKQELAAMSRNARSELANARVGARNALLLPHPDYDSARIMSDFIESLRRD